MSEPALTRELAVTAAHAAASCTYASLAPAGTKAQWYRGRAPANGGMLASIDELADFLDQQPDAAAEAVFRFHAGRHGIAAAAWEQSQGLRSAYAVFVSVYGSLAAEVRRSKAAAPLLVVKPGKPRKTAGGTAGTIFHREHFGSTVWES